MFDSFNGPVSPCCLSPRVPTSSANVCPCSANMFKNMPGLLIPQGSCLPRLLPCLTAFELFFPNLSNVCRSSFHSPLFAWCLICSLFFHTWLMLSPIGRCFHMSLLSLPAAVTPAFPPLYFCLDGFSHSYCCPTVSVPLSPVPILADTGPVAILSPRLAFYCKLFGIIRML